MFEPVRAPEGQTVEEFLAAQFYLGDLPKPLARLSIQEAEDLVNASRLAEYLSDGRERFIDMRGNLAAQMEWVNQYHQHQRREMDAALHRPLSMQYEDQSSAAIEWSVSAITQLLAQGGVSMAPPTTRGAFRRFKSKTADALVMA